jgi:2-succinyl-6-hydroxy-2,4-cyclohexadiene-1-carboxylate synthase
MKLHCIHGNLQTKRVWEPLVDRFESLDADLSLVCEDLHEGHSLGFEQWTEEFCQRAQRDSQGEKTFLLGYSLGGRLALHACLAKPDLWSGVIVVSSDPGLCGPDEKKLQLEKDKQWAERFRSEPMESLLAEWDDLPVFCSIPNSVPRNSEELDAEKTARFFDLFSKGRQSDLLPGLSRLQAPSVLYLSGEKDSKYGELGEKLTASCSVVRHKIIPNAGHRVPWENPDSFVETVLEFMGSVSSG